MWPRDAPRRYNRHYGWVTVPSVTSQWVHSQNSLFFPCFMNSGVSERSNVSTFPISGKFVDRPEAIHCYYSQFSSGLCIKLNHWIAQLVSAPLNSLVVVTGALPLLLDGLEVAQLLEMTELPCLKSGEVSVDVTCVFELCEFLPAERTGDAKGCFFGCLPKINSHTFSPLPTSRLFLPVADKRHMPPVTVLHAKCGQLAYHKIAQLTVIMNAVNLHNVRGSD